MKTRENKIYIHLSYCPKKETLERKFGTIPLRYFKTHLQTYEELELFKKALKLFKFDVEIDDKNINQNKMIMPPPAASFESSSSSSSSSSSALVNKRKIEEEDDDVVFVENKKSKKNEVEEGEIVEEEEEEIQNTQILLDNLTKMIM